MRTVAMVVFAGTTFASLPASAGEAERSAVMSCAASSADMTTFAGCVGTILTANEARKCFQSNFKDCYGPNNTIRQLIERNVTGPIDDIRRGEIGSSSESVWRKAGFPRIRLW